jgi:shikimate dehydrogenase
VGGTVRAIDDRHNIETADVIINATSLGMSGKAEMPGEVLASLALACAETVVLDMVYQPLETELLKAARAAGLQTVDGLAMLVGQAAEAFRLFFGAEPPRDRDDELRALLTS